MRRTLLEYAVNELDAGVYRRSCRGYVGRYWNTDWLTWIRVRVGDVAEGDSNASGIWSDLDGYVCASAKLQRMRRTLV